MHALGFTRATMSRLTQKYPKSEIPVISQPLPAIHYPVKSIECLQYFLLARLHGHAFMVEATMP